MSVALNSMTSYPYKDKKREIWTQTHTGEKAMG